MKWFKAEHYYTPSIRVEEVDKATEHKVFFKGISEFKHANGHTWFPTWEEAHNHLIGWAEQKVQQARRSLELAHGVLGNVKGMKPPTQQP